MKKQARSRVAFVSIPKDMKHRMFQLYLPNTFFMQTTKLLAQTVVIQKL